jgi:hypothetical protein
MICVMIFFKSFYGAVTHSGLSSAIFLAWVKNIGKNMIFAIPLQLLIAGPIIRRLFRNLFPHGTVQEIPEMG